MPAFCRVTRVGEGRARFRHPHRDVAAERRMDRRLPQQRQRRLRRHIRSRLSGHGGGGQARLRLRQHRHGNGASNPAQRRSAHRPSAEMEGLGKPVDPCDDGRRQGYRQGVLWRGAEAFLLHRLLDRRPAGPDRSANIIPRTTTAFSSARRSSAAPGGTPPSRGTISPQISSRGTSSPTPSSRSSTRPPSPPATPRATGSSRIPSSPILRLAISIPRR